MHSAESKHKHLDFLQLTITRMSVNSFLIKGWSVTLVSALFAFAAKESNVEYVIITYVSTPLFWLLDGYYLSQERQYRALYNRIRVLDENAIDFDLDASGFRKGRNQWFHSIFSKTLNIFYGVLVGITVIVMFVIN